MVWILSVPGGWAGEMVTAYAGAAYQKATAIVETTAAARRARASARPLRPPCWDPWGVPGWCDISCCPAFLWSDFAGAARQRPQIVGQGLEPWRSRQRL